MGEWVRGRGGDLLCIDCASLQSVPPSAHAPLRQARMCVCLYARLYMYVRMYMYICICTYVYVSMYLYMYIYICICVCMHACMYVCTDAKGYARLGVDPSGDSHNKSNEMYGYKFLPFY